MGNQDNLKWKSSGEKLEVTLSAKMVNKASEPG